jgi:anti-sigma factor RsiW
MICCSEFDRCLCDFIANELPADERAACEEHANHCVKCKAHLESYRITIEISRHLSDHPVPENLAAKIRDLLIRQQRESVSG